MTDLRTMMVSLASAGCMLFFAACPSPLRPPTPTIELTVDYVSSKEIWLGMRLLNSSQPGNIAVKRDGALVYSNTNAPPIILIRDTLLTPRQGYLYRAERFDGPNDQESVNIFVTTPDTTHHSIAWQVDTLGVQGMIRDIWIFDQNNIWAVGEIEVDSASLFGIAIWNGSIWTPQRFEAVGPTGAISNLRPSGIYAFSTTDVWFASGGVFRWNGISVTPYWINPFEGNPNPILSNGQGASKIWGTSGSNLYIVGTKGAIARFNGSNWTKMESGTTVDLEDIWGVDENHIWTTGTNIQDGRSVLLFFDGTKWNTIYDNLGKPLNELYAFGSVWTNRTNSFHAIGQSYLRTFSLHDAGPPKLRNLPNEFVAFRVRGMNEADMFVSGQGSELAHFNGSTWHLYPEIKALDGGFSAWWQGISVRTSVVAVGGMKFTGVNAVPIVLRGYR